MEGWNIGFRDAKGQESFKLAKGGEKEVAAQKQEWEATLERKGASGRFTLTQGAPYRENRSPRKKFRFSAPPEIAAGGVKKILCGLSYFIEKTETPGEFQVEILEKHERDFKEKATASGFVLKPD